MSDRLSRGPVQVMGNTTLEINSALLQVQNEIDEIRGLRGRVLLNDRVRVDNPVQTKDAVNLDTADSSIVVVGANVFTKSFISANQTITAGATLSLTHSLGAMPQLIQTRLKNLIAELGYSVGDELVINPSTQDAGESRGTAMVPDVTSIVIRFGSGPATFQILAKDTGNGSNITNANWALIVRAYA